MAAILPCIQVHLPSICLLLIFLNPTEATNIDGDYDETQAQPTYKRALIIMLAYFTITASFLFCNCLRKRVVEQQRDGGNDEAAEHDEQSCIARKMDVHVMETFPVMIFPPPDAKFRLTECHICLEELEQGESVMVLPACGHAYHKECVLRWMTTRDSRCPAKLHQGPVKALDCPRLPSRPFIELKPTL